MTENLRGLPERLGRIAYGGDYNPEQWPEEVWAEDVRLMKQAGVSLVSVGIFGWALVEPRPGEFDFGWFDRVLDNLAEAGISAAVATMTASPPPWLAKLHPETLPRRADGTVLWPGARQAYCPSSPVYREHATRLVSRIAERYADHPALALWHIGNEYGCHVRACYCDISAAAFREWLRERYGGIAELNDAWSTKFWSQRYDDFDEVLPPRTAPTFANPTQQLDFARFSSDTMLDLLRMEKAVLRAATPDVPVTTNHVPLAKTLDLHRWASEVDVVSYDSYPDPHDPQAHVLAALSYDVIRSLRGGQPWLLMEQAPCAVNWRERNGVKQPGQMRLWSWQAVAQGADAVMFFQWRQSKGGAEKFHSAMVPHTGPDSRTFREVAGLGAELAETGSLVDTRPDNDVALVLDWESWWALELNSHPATLDQLDAFLAHYSPLFDANIGCDVVHPDSDLSGYRLVVVPNLYLTRAETAANLTEHVRRGGHLLVSFFSGIVDESDQVHLGGYLGPLREVLGAHVAEFWPLADGESVGVSVLDSAERGVLWSEDIVADGAEVVGRFTDGGLAGGAALTRNSFGDGVAWYLGTRLGAEGMRALLDRVVEDSGVSPVVAGLPAGVQAVRRGGRVFLLNHNVGSVAVSVAGGRVEIPGFGVEVLAG
ncbi:beta-galactosidase [Saccharopolyspora shandongensis]|uniref:Beta-galactosidase n=1 Tax=Saccharopolyspora shandongensis TaxID=418495 RepID=A0A1H3TPG8_9PSEU|nr:beta-galactosidase [Saccharopolyspora shandongensis]SDZ52162.1 beta-galactosidase [Saccharopolyspora shandongensis]